MIVGFAAVKFSRFGILAEAVTGTHFQAMRAAHLTKKDVMIGFSRSGNARDIIEATLAAKERGATCIGVTNKTGSYFAENCRHQYSVKSMDTRFRDDMLASRIEHFAVVDVLLYHAAPSDIHKGPSRITNCYGMLCYLGNIETWAFLIQLSVSLPMRFLKKTRKGFRTALLDTLEITPTKNCDSPAITCHLPSLLSASILLRLFMLKMP